MARMDVCTFRYDIKKWHKLKKKYKDFNSKLRKILDGMLNE
jgi:hypothetical protein